MITKETKKMITIRMLELGITQYDIANKIGVTQGAVSNWFSGAKGVPLHQIKQLEEVLKLLPGQLAYAERSTAGSLLEAGGKKSNQASIDKRIHNIPILTSTEVMEWVKRGVLPTKKLRSRTVMIEQKGIKEEDLFMMPVQNNVMEAVGNPLSLRPGDYLIVDKTQKPIPGESIVIADIGEKGAVTRCLTEDGGKLYLTALDKNYQPIPVTDEVTILGVVIESRKYYTKH